MLRSSPISDSLKMGRPGLLVCWLEEHVCSVRAEAEPSQRLSSYPDSEVFFKSSGVTTSLHIGTTSNTEAIKTQIKDHQFYTKNNLKTKAI